MKNGIWDTTYIESILGPPDRDNKEHIQNMISIGNFPEFLLRYYYFIEKHFQLLLTFDKNNELSSLQWNHHSWQTGWIIAAKLEDFFEELPERWQNIIIFNMDLFK